ncbi:MAG TPA: HAD-IA family hydrolase [Microlunatus sp.]
MPTELIDRTFAAVIFDMDGTLIDSTPAVLRAWSRWALDEGVPVQALSGYHGVPSAGVVAAVLPPQRRAEALDRINRLELTDTDGIVPLPGAIDAFDRLPADRLAIATSCTAPLAGARLMASGLTPPKVLVTVDDVEHGKPAPDPYLAAAERLGFDAADCLVVEDAPKGIQSGRAAGAATLAVITTSPRNELAAADLVVPNLAAVDWLVDPASGEVRLRVR